MSVYVDAHHHVWRLERGDYGWLQPTSPHAPIYRDFGLDELRPSLAAAGIGATILVQAAPTVAETRYLLEVADASEGLVRGVVGWVDLAAPDAVATLAELAANPLLKSIRPMLHDLDDPAWILRDGVQPALSALTPLGLRFDALVRPRELKPLLRMLDRHPELAVVIDHCAKPDIAGGGWQPWADDIATIAANTSASCKLSGLVTEAGGDWTTTALRRYADHVLQCFGCERVLWGSDWPVLTLATSYAAWDAATRALLADLPVTDRNAVRGGNARRFYALAG
jgi:L-fuconolactonase